MLDRLLVAVFSAVILVALLVGMVDMLVPFLLKAEFDALCRAALFLMDAQGGLGEEDRQSLADALSAAGFGDISVLATEGAPFGAPLVLEVSATAPVRTVTAAFQEERGIATLWFRKQTVCRRIATYPGEVQ